MSQSFERLFLVSQIDGTVSLQRAINPTSNAEWLGTGVCVCVSVCMCVRAWCSVCLEAWLMLLANYSSASKTYIQSHILITLCNNVG